jgi:hypothetical protein
MGDFNKLTFLGVFSGRGWKNSRTSIIIAIIGHEITLALVALLASCL